MSTENYVPPKVWTFEKANGGTFASINRPAAGATHDKPLPRGRHPIQLYSQGTWNGIKVTVGRKSSRRARPCSVAAA